MFEFTRVSGRRGWTLDSGGFPKIRPCRWRNAEPSPPAYVPARKGTGKQRLGGADPDWTPEASLGFHLGISVGSPERTTPSISPWIPSEGRSVSPSGVSPKIVSWTRNALTSLAQGFVSEAPYRCIVEIQQWQLDLLVEE